MLTFGDCDAVTLEHAVRFLQLRGGDVNGDFVGVPASQLAVFPGTTHFFGLSRTAMVLDAVTTSSTLPSPPLSGVVMRMLHIGLRVTDLDESLAFYTGIGYKVLGTCRRPSSAA